MLRRSIPRAVGVRGRALAERSVRWSLGEVAEVIDDAVRRVADALAEMSLNVD